MHFWFNNAKQKQQRLKLQSFIIIKCSNRSLNVVGSNKIKFLLNLFFCLEVMSWQNPILLLSPKAYSALLQCGRGLVVHWCVDAMVVIRWLLVLNLIDFKIKNFCLRQISKRLSFGHLGFICGFFCLIDGKCIQLKNVVSLN